MKKIFTIIILLFLASSLTQAQVLLVKWTFPTGTFSDSIADGGLAVNLDKAIHSEGGTSAINFSKNGATTKAAQATGWDNGILSKSWVVMVNTLGYENLKLSSKMQSGGNNPGPKDFKVQYRIGSSGDWTDIPGSILVVSNDWTDGVLDSIALPVVCNNQPTLYLRWIMTTNTNSEGGDVASNGINKIDDIFLTGKMGNTGIPGNPKEISFRVSPNPSNGQFVVESVEPISELSVYDSGGKCVYRQDSFKSNKISLKLDNIPQGTYFLKIITIDGKSGNQKLIIC